jgi:hypothetical protein
MLSSSALCRYMTQQRDLQPQIGSLIKVLEDPGRETVKTHGAAHSSLVMRPDLRFGGICVDCCSVWLPSTSSAGAGK